MSGRTSSLVGVVLCAVLLSGTPVVVQAQFDGGSAQSVKPGEAVHSGGGFSGGIYHAPPSSQARPVPTMLKTPVPADFQPVDPTPKDEHAIYEALRKSVEVNFVETPLKDVVAFLAKETGVEFHFARLSLIDMGIDVDTIPVSLTVAGISAEAVLQIVLDRLEITWDERHGQVWITGRDQTVELSTPRRYDVADLVVTRTDDGVLVSDFDQLKNVLMQTTSGAWNDLYGVGGTIQPFEAPGIDVLYIRHSDAVHREVVSILKGLRALRNSTDAVRLPPQSPREEAMEKALEKVISVDFNEVPLAEAIAALSKQIGQPMLLDEKSLENEGLFADEPVTATLNKLPARVLLTELLNPYDIDWNRQHEVIWITSKVEAEKALITYAYNVPDLVTHRDITGTEVRDASGLVELLQTTPDSMWEDIDGAGGNVQSFIIPGINALLIEQSQDTHDEIVKLLADVRAARRDGEVETIPPAVQEKIKQQPPGDLGGPSPQSSGVGFGGGGGGAQGGGLGGGGGGGGFFSVTP